jgi:uncharacterized OB-fold protein
VTVPDRPVPISDEVTRPYWEGAAAHELRIQHCDPCDRYIHFPAPQCPTCARDELSWRRMSGSGRVYTYTVIHHVGGLIAFAEDVPYVNAWVELDEQAGLRVLARLACDPDQATIGMRVEVSFVDRENVTLPYFRPTEL